jgi:hypothetical protein
VLTPEQLWDLLGRVQSLAFVARSETAGGWNGEGRGKVIVQAAGEGGMTFSERGSWRPKDGRNLRFTNTYRWTLTGGLLRLEHLRYGSDRPVLLFDLVQVGDREWRSASPHLCGQDCYAAVMAVGDDGIVLRWSIDGPRKRETIEYVYSWNE